MKIIRLKKGDLLIKALEKKVKDLKGGIIVGIGAISWAELKLYDLNKKEYKSGKIEGPLEVASFSAVVGFSPDGKKTLHAHICVSNDSFEVMGGHLEEGEVAATFEAAIFESENEVRRYYDSNIGLNLIKK